MPPISIGWSRYADTSDRHDGGIDHKKIFKRLKLIYKFYP